MYTIKALRNFYTDFPAPAIAMYFQNKLDEMIQISGYIWLIRGSGKTIVVDAGIGKPPEKTVTGVQKVTHFTVAPGEDTASLLRREGIEPAEVDYLILTHLHMDHCLNAPLFERAQICISREGWESVINPRHPSLVPDHLFPRHVYSYLQKHAWDQVLLLEREQQVLPGIDVFYTGGHTPCSQAVAVQTKAGCAVITGDVVSLYGNIEENTPVAYCHNLLECYQAMDRIREQADIVLPSHDPEVLTRHPGGLIG